IYRLVGTVVGVVASIAIAGLLNETRDLFLFAVALWLALCVFAAGQLDGSRAYGAVLSGYTVAIVAVPNIDSPQDTFASGIDRGAAIVIGIAAIAVVNDVFAAPNILPNVLKKVEDAHRKVRAYAREALRRGGAEPDQAGALLREVTALHPEVTTLAGESISGSIRAAGAGRALAAMVREVSAARAVSAALVGLGQHGAEARHDLEAALSGECHGAPPPLEAGPDAPTLSDVPGRRRLVAACAGFVLRNQDHDAAAGIAALRSGRGPGRGPRLPLYKSRRSAVRDGSRVFVAVVLSSALFILSGWPQTSTALLQLCALAGISATNPNPRAFSIGAVVAMPLATAVAGVTEFLVLDGVDAFPLLAIAMALPVFAACLLMTAGRPLLYGIGFLLLVYFPVLLSPANPQSYNPQAFLYSGLLSIVSVIVLFVCLSTLFPTDDKRRRAWILRSSREDLRDALSDRGQWYAPPAAAYRDADRIGQLHGLTDGDAETRAADLRTVIGYADLAAAARRFHAEGRDRGLRRVAKAAFDDGREALEGLHPAGLRRAASLLLGAVADRSTVLRTAGRRGAADLVWAAALIERNPQDLDPRELGRR
ncbi:MAG: FUSC family protein, partial [Parafilimonas terrae]|nr:FUSC family protein [Parafilimonas terrae]